MGRPSDYTLEVAAEICARIVDGQSLRTICCDEGMPDVRTVYRWLNAQEEFRHQYARAKEDQADTLADEIIDIADDGRSDYIKTEDGRELVDHDHIARSRLRVDSRKWIASKLKPKKYGERVQAELTGKDGAPLGNTTDPLDVARRLAFLLTAPQYQKPHTLLSEPDAPPADLSPAPSNKQTGD